MLTDFDKQFLLEDLFKKLIKFQHYFFKPSLLGLIQLDNCLDEYAYYEYSKGARMNGNLYGGIQHYNKYQVLFHEYLNILVELGDLPIYPSKKVFLQNLVINGKYTFLNFSSVNERDSKFYVNKKGNIDSSIVFEYNEDFEINNKKTEKHSIIRNDEISKYYKTGRYLYSHPEDFHIKGYQTLSIENISDEEFEGLFKASNFLPENIDIENPMQYRIHLFIQKLIKDGEEYNKEQEETKKKGKITDFKGIYDDFRDIVVKEEETNHVISTIFLKESDSLSIGSNILVIQNNYIITDIIKECNNKTAIYVKEA